MTDFLKLHLACGENFFEDGWVNIDLRNVVSCRLYSNFIIANLSRGIPIRSNSIDVIFCSHFLEHLDPFLECNLFLSECFRILKYGGVIRIVVPDLCKIAQIYLDNPRQFFCEYSYEKPWFYKAKTWNRRIGVSIMYEHKMIYDKISLEEVIEYAGFSNFSSLDGCLADRINSYPFEGVKYTHVTHSLIADAEKR